MDFTMNKKIFLTKLAELIDESKLFNPGDLNLLFDTNTWMEKALKLLENHRKLYCPFYCVCLLLERKIKV